MVYQWHTQSVTRKGEVWVVVYVYIGVLYLIIPHGMQCRVATDRPFPPFRYFPNLSASPKYMLAIECYVHIWQVSQQLSCGHACQIWMWCKESNRYLSRIENFAYGEINERSFSNPHPRSNCNVNSLTPGRRGCNIRRTILKRIRLIDILSTSNGETNHLMPQDHIWNRSTLV